MRYVSADHDNRPVKIHHPQIRLLAVLLLLVVAMRTQIHAALSVIAQNGNQSVVIPSEPPNVSRENLHTGHRDPIAPGDQLDAMSNHASLAGIKP